MNSAHSTGPDERFEERREQRLDAAGCRGDAPQQAWGSTIRLALVVSTVAAIVAATFAGRIAESTLIVSIIAVASLVGWHHAEHPADAAPLRVGRR